MEVINPPRCAAGKSCPGMKPALTDTGLRERERLLPDVAVCVSLSK